jgi:hypothetical protein
MSSVKCVGPSVQFSTSLYLSEIDNNKMTAQPEEEVTSEEKKDKKKKSFFSKVNTNKQEFRSRSGLN